MQFKKAECPLQFCKLFSMCLKCFLQSNISFWQSFKVSISYSIIFAEVDGVLCIYLSGFTRGLFRTQRQPMFWSRPLFSLTFLLLLLLLSMSITKIFLSSSFFIFPSSYAKIWGLIKNPRSGWKAMSVEERRERERESQY